jgi:hypothetical protein
VKELNISRKKINWSIKKKGGTMKSIKKKHFCYLGTAFFILMTFTITLTSQEKLANKLFGTYLFIKESSEYSLGADAQILLKLQAPNIASIIAAKPGIPTVTDTGTFSIQGKKITISFPALGKEATDADYSFDGKQLILPFLAIGDGEGTSTWEKIEFAPYDLIEVISLYHQDLLASQSRESALEKMKIRLEKNPRVKKVGIVPGKSILITYESGYQEFFLMLPGFYDSTSKSRKYQSIFILWGIPIGYGLRFIFQVYTGFQPSITDKLGSGTAIAQGKGHGR